MYNNNNDTPLFFCIYLFTAIDNPGKLMRGFVQYLPRHNIELYVLLPPQKRDNTTQYIIDWADHWRSLPNSLEVARKIVSDLKLHAIIYPDIGMEVGLLTCAFACLCLLGYSCGCMSGI